MTQRTLVLFQFELKGQVYTQYEQEGIANQAGLYNSLPFFYSIVFVTKHKQVIEPIGGLLIKTDMAKNDSEFAGKVLEVAEACDVASALRRRASTFYSIKTDMQSEKMPSSDDFNRIALETSMRVGQGGVS